VGAAEEEAAAAALVEAENVLVEGRGREGGGGAGLSHMFAGSVVARRTSETPLAVECYQNTYHNSNTRSLSIFFLIRKGLSSN